MTDLYLVAHKVRGQPAFDIATQIECPVCHDANSCGDYEGPSCHECDGLGYWWIIPTSGHRAYPYWHKSILDLHGVDKDNEPEPLAWLMPSIPPTLPDHYPHASTPTLDLATALGLHRATKPMMPSKPFPRRI